MSSVIYYYILAFGGIILVGIIGKRAGWFQMVSTTNRLLREQNSELVKANELLKQQLMALRTIYEGEKKEWSDKYHEADKQIAELRGRLDATINIPLTKIDKSLRILSKVGQDNTIANKSNASILKTVSHINQKILEQLQDSAKLLLDNPIKPC